MRGRPISRFLQEFFRSGPSERYSWRRGPQGDEPQWCALRTVLCCPSVPQLEEADQKSCVLSSTFLGTTLNMHECAFILFNYSRQRHLTSTHPFHSQALQLWNPPACIRAKTGEQRASMWIKMICVANIRVIYKYIFKNLPCRTWHQPWPNRSLWRRRWCPRPWTRWASRGWPSLWL